MYVNNLATGGNSLKEVNKNQRKLSTTIQKGGFNLHKWNSNVSHLESENSN